MRARLSLSPYASIAIVTIACRLPSFLRAIFDDDEAQYAAIGELVRAGGRLYRDGGVDFKPPAIYWTYASVFHLAGRYSMWAMHLLALLVVLGTAWILCAIGTRLATKRAGLYAGVFYGVFTTVYYPKMLAANTEIFMMLALSAMTLLVLRARDGKWIVPMLAAGALVALASAYKQSGAANLVVIAAGVVATRHWFGRLAVAGTGFLAMLGIGALVVVATSSLGDMWHWAVTRMLATHTSSAWQQGSVWHNVEVGLLPFVASSLVLWVFGGLAVKRLRGARVELIVWLWFAVSLASSFASSHFFGHYFIQPVAPLSVLAAIELDRGWESRKLRIVALVLTVVPAVAFFVFNVVFEPLTEQFGAPSPDFRVPVAWIASHTAPDDRIFVWGNFSPIYVLANRLPASRFVGFMRGAERNHDAPPEASWDTGPEVWPLLAEDFAAHPPTVIVDTSTADYMSFGHYPMQRFPAIAAIVARDYAIDTVVGGVTMYRRR